jgi:hypothetical protein
MLLHLPKYLEVEKKWKCGMFVQVEESFRAHRHFEGPDHNCVNMGAAFLMPLPL